MLDQLAPMRKMREAAYRRKFIDNVDEHLFMGSYPSFEAAAAAAPTSKPLGFDNAEEARKLYSQQVFFFDYPGLFWLGRSLEDGMRSVFDLGGHAGIKFHAFRRMLNYPPDLHWTVCDVPGVVQAGLEIAAERGVGKELDFTTDFKDASGYDVLFIAGTLQFMPETLTQVIDALAVKPKRIILNTTAVHADRAIFTVHSLGFGFSPYRIQRYDDLIAQLTNAGYKRRDVWRNEGKPIDVPFVEGGDSVYYAGCCFDLL
ncbi:MAG: methyltransferase, TIGR04325 family [Variovorax sp.]